MNLFHVGKQYLTFCKAEAAVTHNLIGRKIISNVKHSDARNSLPILDVIRSSDKRHSAPKYCKWTLRQTTGVCYTRIYVLGAPSHFPTEYAHEAAVVSREHRMKWVVVLGDGYQWPLPWECTTRLIFKVKGHHARGDYHGDYLVDSGFLPSIMVPWKTHCWTNVWSNHCTK